MTLATIGIVAWCFPASVWPVEQVVAVASPAPFPTPIRHVLVVFFENEEESSVLAQGPFEKYLTVRYASAGQFYSVMHYSLPNYLAATSGYTSNLFKPVNVTNVGRLASDLGESWSAYMESMPYSCDPSSSGTYDVYHSPFVMYDEVLEPASYCDRHVVNFSAWNAAVSTARLPNYGLVIPNDNDDGHNTNISTADAWLHAWFSPLRNSTEFRTTAVFVVYDEGAYNDTAGKDNTTGGGHIYLALASPYARSGYISQVPYNTFDLLTTTEWLLGLGRTGEHDSWSANPPMEDLFSFGPAWGTPGSGPLPLGSPTGGAPGMGPGPAGSECALTRIPIQARPMGS